MHRMNTDMQQVDTMSLISTYIHEMQTFHIVLTQPLQSVFEFL